MTSDPPPHALPERLPDAPAPRPADRASTHARVAAIALPVVLSNATVPLQGAIDTAIIGNLGAAEPLAAVTLGATVLALVLGSFNFLQIGASGLSAQALGAGDRQRVMNTLARALLIAGAIALALNLLATPIIGLALQLFEARDETEALAASYLRLRLLGAPAELANYALIGWFTGQEMTRRLFELQLVTSLANIALNLVLVLGFEMGVDGVAIGTALASYLGLCVGLWRVRQRAREIAPPGYRLQSRLLFAAAELRRLMALNRDIFIRTFCLTGGFAYMARLGSLEGDVVLAANGVLLQFLYVSAYALDGFAMAAETLVGQAVGAGDRKRLRRAVVVSTVSAVALAAVFSLVASLLAGPIVRLFTNVEEVRRIAEAHMLWATCLPLVAVFAYQLDGIFVGAADGRGMRNAMLLSVVLYLPLGWGLTTTLGNHGLWLALWIWMGLRATTLALRYPALEMRAKPINFHV
ncbi:MAG: MATE family efflux transporter [Pikeienuella sp.]